MHCMNIRLRLYVRVYVMCIGTSIPATLPAHALQQHLILGCAAGASVEGAV